MADLLLIRAGNGKEITWSFEDKTMVGYHIALDTPPQERINDGDVWQVELCGTTKKNQTKIATVRLVAKVQELKPWEKITSLKDFWIDPDDLRTILILLHEGADIILIGPKGAGKTTLGYALAESLGWQEPYKFDIYTIKQTTDLFGTEAANKGSTFFVKSGLLNYIERARIALQNDLEAQFIVILDEINRVHAKVNESLHGLFDDTKQVTINTTEGSRTIKLPQNIHFIGTMNMGAEYLGTHGLDEALKDRFAPVRVKAMPEDYEVKKLVGEAGIMESQALKIVQVAQALRGAANAGKISYSPSYRACRNVARLIKHGFDLQKAAIKGFLQWYEGEFSLDQKGEMLNPNSEMAQAYASLRMKGVAKTREAIAEIMKARV